MSRTGPRRALLSASDKTGLAAFARELAERGWQVLSTGGTARALDDAGAQVVEIAAVTGHPEMMDGRVKTLHPAVHAGLLARRDHAGDMAELARAGYAPIDLVAVNLYPFRETVAKPGTTPEEAMEQVDIGGPALIRAAAKNHARVWPVVDPRDYDAVLEALAGGSAAHRAGLRRRLAAKAFSHVSHYDHAVAAHLEELAEQGGGAGAAADAGAMPRRKVLRLARKRPLRYGENPGQRAAFYARTGSREGVAGLEQLHGRELSYNNILDLDGTLACLAPFAFASGPAACIVKHATPCGIALRPALADAFERARATDPVSAFGGVVAVNRRVDRDAAERIGAIFVECVAAPDFGDGALEVLTAKKNVRLLRFPGSDAAGFLARAAGGAGATAFRSVYGGVLAQSLPEPFFFGAGGGAGAHSPGAHAAAAAQGGAAARDGWRVATSRAPTAAERRDLEFAWAAVAGVKSNAILLARDAATVGIGAGQTSRVDSSKLAARKAAEAGLAGEVAGCVLASDAFFPFRDGVDAAAEAGVTAVVQPGGSVRDGEVVEAADEHGIAMVFTGRRVFRH